jgi:multidrug efflux pump subunit AcrB
MAVTVIFGLLVATVLTMVVLPVFYSIVFKVKAP